MQGRERVERYVVGHSRQRPASLHDFMTKRVNPLLVDGWSLRDVRITDVEQEPGDRCALEVRLVRLEPASAAESR